VFNIPFDLLVFPVLKDIVYRYLESSSDSESKFQGRHILPLLEGDDSLAGAANSIGQFLLRHLVVVETQSPDPVCHLVTRDVILLSDNRSGHRHRLPVC